MIIAVVSVGIVEMTVHEVTGVIAVGNRFVAASGSVDVTRVLAGTGVVRRASVRIDVRNLDSVLFDLSTIDVMETAVVEIVDVVLMTYGGVSATLPVLMFVVSVQVFRHSVSP